MKNLFNKLGAAAGTAITLALPFAAGATSDTYSGLSGAQSGLTDVGSTLDSSATGATLPEMIGNIINVLLGVLGIVFVVLVVYSGFLYLTDAGSDEGIKKAKKILRTSVMGLVLIVAAYAIADYVISALVGATST